MTLRDILILIVAIGLIGGLAWVVTYLIPMPDIARRAIYVVAAVFIVLYVLSALGLLPPGVIR